MKKDTAPQSIRRNLPFLRKVCGNLQCFRKRLRISQAKLANALGLSQRHIQKIESGNTDVRASLLRGAGACLQVSPCYLINDRAIDSVLQGMGLGCRVELLDYIPIGLHVLDIHGKQLYRNRWSEMNLALRENTSDKETNITDYLLDPQEIPEVTEYLRILSSERPSLTTLSTSLCAPGRNAINARLEWALLLDDRETPRGFVVSIIPITLP